MQPGSATPLPCDGVELKGHTRCVSRVVALPDGERIATACNDSAVRVFSTDTGDCLHNFTGHRGWVVGLAALSDEVLTSIDANGLVILWDAAYGDQLCSLKVNGYAIAVSALGADRFLASADGDLVFFSHTCGRDVAQLHKISGSHANWITDIAAASASQPRQATRPRRYGARPRASAWRCLRDILTGSLASR
jgi:WD40 repeat protein